MPRCYPQTALDPQHVVGLEAFGNWISSGRNRQGIKHDAPSAGTFFAPGAHHGGPHRCLGRPKTRSPPCPPGCTRVGDTGRREASCLNALARSRPDAYPVCNAIKASTVVDREPACRVTSSIQEAKRHQCRARPANAIAHLGIVDLQDAASTSFARRRPDRSSGDEEDRHPLRALMVPLARTTPVRTGRHASLHVAASIPFSDPSVISTATSAAGVANKN